MKRNENRKHHSVVLVKQGRKFCVYVGDTYADCSGWWFFVVVGIQLRDLTLDVSAYASANA